MLRAQHAVQIRDGLAAQLVTTAKTSDIHLTPEKEAVLLTDLDQMPDITRWDSVVPLVLLEGMYLPYADLLPPLPGIDGDVQEPSNIIWLVTPTPTPMSNPSPTPAALSTLPFITRDRLIGAPSW